MTTPTTKPTPIPFAETTAWSPCHLGRALAIAAAHPGMTVAITADKRLVDMRPLAGEDSEVYGSDLGAHLELLAAREREKAKR